jgi:hypothetical protein
LSGDRLASSDGRFPSSGDRLASSDGRLAVSDDRPGLSCGRFVLLDAWLSPPGNGLVRTGGRLWLSGSWRSSAGG